MTEKLWKIADVDNSIEHPYDILNRLCGQLYRDSEFMFKADIISGVNHAYEDNEQSTIYYAVYITVAELNNYGFRLMEVSYVNIGSYPVKLKYLCTDNHVTFTAANPVHFEKKLKEFIQLPETAQLLGKLQTHVLIQREKED